ncbi:MAG: ribonuclease Y [Opitutales bacterium]
MNSYWISGFIFGVLVGAGVFALIVWRRFERRVEVRKQRMDVEAREARLALQEEKARLELDYRRKESDLEHKCRTKEQDNDTRARELKWEGDRLAARERELESKEKDLEVQRRNTEASEHEAEKVRRLYRLKLHQISGIDREEARQLFLKATEKECERELQDYRRKLLERSEAEVADQARRILLAAMQRVTSQPMNDATATVVPLPNEEMKGRIIGREGRNIRSFEHVTGATLMIDETPDSVLVSCFDPVRRETARIALEALLRDGRIHPANIEEEVAKAEQEMHANVIEAGEDTIRKLRLHRVNPEIAVLLGKLHYRLSNNQNTLAHSVEVANLCSILASEIGLDPALAKRSGLFHDIGKAMDAEYEGSHATAGADMLRQYGEDPRVVNAVAAHHEEVAAESAYAALVRVADSLSAVRPGARSSSIEGFVQRVRSIEEVAANQAGVIEAYAIQAGREVRVIVEPGEVDDDGAKRIARQIRARIEEELNYPGSIEITVVRETRFSETAH